MYSMVLMVAMTTSPEAAAFGNKSCQGGSCHGGLLNSCQGGGLFSGLGCHGSSCHGGGLFSGLGCNGSSCHGGGLFGGKSHGCSGGLFSGSSCHGNSCQGSSCHGSSLFGGKSHGCSGGLFSGTSCHGGSLFGGKSCHGGGLFGNSCHGGIFGGKSCHGGTGCQGTSCHGCQGGAGCQGVIVSPTVIDTKKDMPAPKKEEKKGGITSAPATIVVSVPADASITIDGLPTKATSTTRTFATPELAPGSVYYYTVVAEVVRNGKTFTASEKIAVEAGATVQFTLNPSDPSLASN